MVHSLLGAGLDLSVSAEPHSGRRPLRSRCAMVSGNTGSMGLCEATLLARLVILELHGPNR
jgi:hypothetical protein